jgi:CRISPR/Cas system-associated exonuclease Cas4 (RecB family)
MKSSEEFTFSQKSLQDYIDCPRRFELRYIQNTDWPAELSKPYQTFEEFISYGNNFHRYADQYFNGLDEKTISDIVEPEIHQWWQRFLNFIHIQKFSALSSEILFKTSLHQFHLIAKFDLLALTEEGYLHIYDWKTTAGTQKPKRRILKEKLQTQIYLFILANSELPFSGIKKVDPNHILMSYWYPQFPNEIETFIYSQNQFETDKKYIFNLIQEIQNNEAGDYQLTENITKCKYCIYRSFCERGIEAGNILKETEELYFSLDDLDIDFDQIKEIEY